MRRKVRMLLNAVCMKCGRVTTERVAEDADLLMCPRCAVKAADSVDGREIQKQGEYDWSKTITAIKKKHKMGKESTVAFALKLHPGVLSHIKKGRRPMPLTALQILKEKYAECQILKVQ